MSTLPYNWQMKATLAVQEIRLRAICRYYGIEHALDHILQPGFATGQPYHNQKHCMVVARWCHDLLVLCPDEVTDEDFRFLLLAALFHDFGHNGVSSDDVQISVAVTNAEVWLRVHGGFEEDDIETILDIIRVTEYKGDLKFTHEPQTLLQRVIRDADLLQVMEPDHIETVMHGLRDEIGRKFGRELSMAEFYEGQVHFMNSMQLFTPIGQELYDKAKPYIITSFYSIAYPNVLQHTDE